MQSKMNTMFNISQHDDLYGCSDLNYSGKVNLQNLRFRIKVVSEKSIKKLTRKPY